MFVMFRDFMVKIRRTAVYAAALSLAFIFVLSGCTGTVDEEASPTPEISSQSTASPTAEPTAVPTPEPTAVPTPTPRPETHVYAPEDGRPWYVRVDTYNQLISVYALDENGEYTRLINQFMTSAGKRDNYTKKVFQELNDDDRYRWKFFSTFGGGYCEYVTRIYKPFLFHSVMFEQQG